jgi:hypothetical protein
MWFEKTFVFEPLSTDAKVKTLKADGSENKYKHEGRAEKKIY